MAKLLALDLSTNVGAAWFGERFEPPVFDTYTLEGTANFKLGQFQIWLEQHYADDPFDALAWERPLLLPTDDVGLIELLYGLVGICRAFVGKLWLVDRITMQWRAIDVPAVKIALTGSAKASKDEMLYAARRTGWKANTHHEADAGGVGFLAYEQIWPKVKA